MIADKRYLSRAISEKLGTTPEEVRRVLAAFDDLALDLLKKDIQVRVLNGSFRTKQVQARVRRNPATGGIVNCPASTKVVFRTPQVRKKPNAPE